MFNQKVKCEDFIYKNYQARGKSNIDARCGSVFFAHTQANCRRVYSLHIYLKQVIAALLISIQNEHRSADGIFRYRAKCFSAAGETFGRGNKKPNKWPPRYSRREREMMRTGAAARDDFAAKLPFCLMDNESRITDKIYTRVLHCWISSLVRYHRSTL